MADAAKKYQDLLDFFDNLLVLEGITSKEHVSLEGGELEPVLDKVSLTARRGEVWAVHSRSPFPVKLLLEIASNLTPPADGQRNWLQQDAPRKHRLPRSIYYIDKIGVLYPYMNSLEAIMFATRKHKGGVVGRQNQIFETLIGMGLGHLSLTPISKLTDQEEAFIQLLIASYSSKPLIIFNLPEYSFDEILLEAMAFLSDKLNKKKSTLILGTTDPLLIEHAVSHAACLVDGFLAFEGRVEQLLEYDRTLLTIRDHDVDAIRDKMITLYPRLQYQVDGDHLSISEDAASSHDPYVIQETMIREGIQPRQITVSQKTVQHALEAVGASHDLP